MKYLVYELGRLKKGDIVEFTLDAQANIKLMERFEYYSYQKNETHKYYGGLATESPSYITVPKDYCYWYATVDLGGYSGTVRASVSVIHND